MNGWVRRLLVGLAVPAVATIAGLLTGSWSWFGVVCGIGVGVVVVGIVAGLIGGAEPRPPEEIRTYQRSNQWASVAPESSTDLGLVLRMLILGAPSILGLIVFYFVR